MVSTQVRAACRTLADRGSIPLTSTVHEYALAMNRRLQEVYV